jgi:hypothetical protein
MLIALLVVALISVAAARDYSADAQKDVFWALSLGIQMGELRQQALIGHNVDEYNSRVLEYQEVLKEVFGSNQTAMQMLWMDAIDTNATAKDAAANVTASSQPPASSKPQIVHSIDGSFNKYEDVQPDSQGLVKGYPAAAAYTAMNDAPPAAGNTGNLVGA